MDNDILLNHITDAKKTVRLLITKKCNLKCIYCYEEGLGNSTNNMSQELDLKDFKNIILALSKQNINRISFSGGEPTLYFEWVDELIKLCDSLKISTTITTNGVSDKIIYLAKTHPYLGIRVSLDFSNSKEYLYFKKVDCFNLVLNNLKELVKLPNIIKINTIVYSLDSFWSDFNNMINLINVNNFNKSNVYLKLLPSYPVNDFKKLSQKELYDYLIKKGIKIAKKKDLVRKKDKYYFEYQGVRIIIQNRGVYSPKCCVLNNNRCVEGIGSIRINPDGRIQPCFGVKSVIINHNDSVNEIFKKIGVSYDFLDKLYVKNGVVDYNLFDK